MKTWSESRLGDEVEFAYGKALPAQSRRSGDVNVYGSNGVVGTHNEALIEGPGIIVGRKGSVGAVNYSEESFWPIDTTYYVVNKAGHDWRFLNYILLSLGLTELNSHSAVPGLNREDAYAIPILIPPLEEQKSIASLLDAIEFGIRSNQEALAATKTLKQALGQQLLAEKSDDPSWVAERIGQSHTVSSGGTPSRSVPEYWLDGTIPWVKTTEVDYRVISETSECITQAGLDNSAAKMLPVGTVLLAMYGQGVTRGKVAVLGIEAASNQACAAIQPANEAVDSRYLYHYLTHQYEDLRQMAHGGQQQNLNLDIVRDFPLRYPASRDEQAGIVEVLDALDVKIRMHEARVPLMEALFRALLTGLMNGDLVVDGVEAESLISPSANGSAA